jgi:hypothetical protein
MVQGESAIGAGVAMRWEGSWMGRSLGEPIEDIDASGWVQGGAECIASCRCSW